MFSNSSFESMSQNVPVKFSYNGLITLYDINLF